VAALSASRYGVAITIILAETDRVVGELKAELRSGRGLAVGALLKSIHDSVRGLRGEIDLSADSPWARQLAAACRDTSNLLRGEIESMPGRAQRLLCPRALQDIAPGSSVDRGDAADVEAQINFVNTCRQYADELAIGDVTHRAWSELEACLRDVAEPLAAALRNAGDSDRSFRQSQFEAAVRYSAVVFGQDYAANLTQSVMGPNERRVVARAS
jgi:hypothetical protein